MPLLPCSHLADSLERYTACTAFTTCRFFGEVQDTEDLTKDDISQLPLNKRDVRFCLMERQSHILKVRSRGLQVLRAASWPSPLP